MKKLFVVGCGRSGTTMLQQALNRHPQIVIPPETGFFLDLLGHTRTGQHAQLKQINEDLKIDCPEPRRRIKRPADVIAGYDRIADLYVKRLGRTDATYFGEKSPRHLLCIRRIARYIPDAKFILIYRDGRDVAISLTEVPWGPNDFYVNFAVWLRFYRWHRWAVKSAAVDLHCVRYEDLVADPRQELEKITDFLDLAYEPWMDEGHGNPEGVPEWEFEWKRRALDPITPSRVHRWRNELSEEQLRRSERWGRHALGSLGYELATDGSHRLPWSFFPTLYWKHTVWRAQCAWRLVIKELFAT